MHRLFWKKLVIVTIMIFVMVAYTVPVFAGTGTGAIVPEPPSGLPNTDTSSPAAGETTPDRDYGTGENTTGTSGGAGSFINTSQGQAELNPTQYADQYQGQFFSRITTAREIFAQLTNFFLSFLGAIAIIFIIYGGFLYITASGDQAKSDKARKVLWGTVMGIIIVFAVYALVSTLLNIGAAVNPGVGVGPLQVGPGGTTLRVPF